MAEQIGTTIQAGVSSIEWLRDGSIAQHSRIVHPSNRFLGFAEVRYPAGDFVFPLLSDPILGMHASRNSVRVNGDVGDGRFQSQSAPGSLWLSAADYASAFKVEGSDELAKILMLTFDVEAWRGLLQDQSDLSFSFDFGGLHRGSFNSPKIEAGMQRLWQLSAEEGQTSQLMAQAAGCEILAELFRLRGQRYKSVRGGLSPWARNRAMELMHARISEDLSLADLAAEARLSVFHFSRMFKESLGLSPQAYLTSLRIKKAAELLAESDLSILEIAQETGYTSGQVLARAFMKHMKMTPSQYRMTKRY
ncbi:AraC family transcriptional regulator [Agrobacterium pusense]|uniref:AraC family transcriptional regulator n=1 Tax=Agrobacterium pusense TaxID=648995 RepID=UPI0028A2CFA8|nr:AraC family transcriptional regulator [Agrobacterium pusense]